MLNQNYFLKYMKYKNINEWVNSFFYKNRNRRDIMNNIFNEHNLPTLHSEHSILTEKIEKTDYNIEDIKNSKDEDNDLLDPQFFSELKDLKQNRILLEKLRKFIPDS